MKNLNKLKSVRNSDTAIFLGCGPSIKDLNKDLINKINKLDIWSSNNFLLNEDITADFHHIEIIQNTYGENITNDFTNNISNNFIINTTDEIGKIKFTLTINYLEILMMGFINQQTIMIVN